MVSIIKSAKSITEAIRLGCEELKCERSDVDVEVLDMGSKGIFGLFGKKKKKGEGNIFSTGGSGSRSSPRRRLKKEKEAPAAMVAEVKTADSQRLNKRYILWNVGVLPEAAPPSAPHASESAAARRS